MGAKLSCENVMETSSSSSSARAMVRVIAADGSLQEFSPPVAASDVLINTPNSTSFFLCNSDSLYFNSFISYVFPEELLRPGHLYFILPLSMLGVTLSHLEMAAMAVKASSAFASSPSTSSSKRRPGGRNIQVMPVLFQDSNNDDNEEYNRRLNEDTLMTTATKRSANSSKVGKRTSTPAKRRHRLVKKRLTAIHEVEVAE